MMFRIVGYVGGALSLGYAGLCTAALAGAFKVGLMVSILGVASGLCSAGAFFMNARRA